MPDRQKGRPAAGVVLQDRHRLCARTVLVSGYPFNSAWLHFFSQSAREQHVTTAKLSFRFPRRGRPESPGLRHVPEKMRFRHGASLGRNDTCRYLSRARFAELTGYPESWFDKLHPRLILQIVTTSDRKAEPFPQGAVSAGVGGKNVFAACCLIQNRRHRPVGFSVFL